MNLAKKGTVLLTALSVFAITSCGSKSVGFLQAREFLKDAKTEEAKTKAIKCESFKWDITTTGTGMEYVKDSGKLGGAQVIIAALIWLNQHSDTFSFAKLLLDPAFQSLSGSYDDTYRAGKFASNCETAFMDQENLLDDIERMSNSYDHKYAINGDLMSASFQREEELDLPGLAEADIPLLTFTEEIVYKKDGFSDHWSITANKMPLKVKWDYTIPQTAEFHVDADGTMNGTISAVFNYQD